MSQEEANVGVVQRGRGARFAAEPFEGERGAGEIDRQELQSDKAAEAGVLGLIDDAHAPAAEFLQDPVVGDVRVDHGSLGR